MIASDIAIVPLAPALGAELTGTDREQPLVAAALDTVYKALIQHQVIFFRAQNLPPP